jgi:hypothetical protein
MDPTEAAVRRMRNLGLTRQPVPDIESVIRGLGAVQSQDYGPAKWSIAQRMKDMTNDALDRAFDEGTFLRTHALRPTWHFLLAEDIRWVQELTGPRVQAQNRHYYRKMELDESIFKKSNSILKKALSASGHLTRNELQGVLSKAGIEAEGMQLAYILMFAEL